MRFSSSDDIHIKQLRIYGKTKRKSNEVNLIGFIFEPSYIDMYKKESFSACLLSMHMYGTRESGSKPLLALSSQSARKLKDHIRFKKYQFCS